MIFVTIGTQLPFDRLVLGVDRWAAERGYEEVFAQVGAKGQPPEHIQWTRDLQADEFDERLEAADLMVSHAGIGSMLSALSLGKPVLVMARLAALQEHRNDHQLATVAKFQAMGLIHVAEDETQLWAKLDELHASRSGGSGAIAGAASDQLLDRLRSFLDGARSPG